MWVISLYYFGSVILFALGAAAELSGAISPLRSPTFDLGARGPLDYLLGLCSALVMLTAAALLFRLSRHAVAGFSIVLAFSTVPLAFQLLAKNWSGVVVVVMIFSWLLSVAFLIGIVLYARHLRAQGVLK